MSTKFSGPASVMLPNGTPVDSSIPTYSTYTANLEPNYVRTVRGFEGYSQGKWTYIIIDDMVYGVSPTKQYLGKQTDYNSARLEEAKSKEVYSVFDDSALDYFDFPKPGLLTEETYSDALLNLKQIEEDLFLTMVESQVEYMSDKVHKDLELAIDTHDESKSLEMTLVSY